MKVVIKCVHALNLEHSLLFRLLSFTTTISSSRSHYPFSIYVHFLHITIILLNTITTIILSLLRNNYTHSLSLVMSKKTHNFIYRTQDKHDIPNKLNCMSKLFNIQVKTPSFAENMHCAKWRRRFVWLIT